MIERIYWGSSSLEEETLTVFFPMRREFLICFQCTWVARRKVIIFLLTAYIFCFHLLPWKQRKTLTFLNSVLVKWHTHVIFRYIGTFLCMTILQPSMKLKSSCYYPMESIILRSTRCFTTHIKQLVTL